VPGEVTDKLCMEVLDSVQFCNRSNTSSEPEEPCGKAEISAKIQARRKGGGTSGSSVTILTVEVRRRPASYRVMVFG
jgi:hypothetical protein